MELSSTIQKASKSTNTNALIIAAIAFLLLALLVAFSVKPLYNHFAGPFDVSAEQLISYQGPKDTFRTYVTTLPDVALDTKYYYFEKQEDGNEKIIHSYYALLFGDRLLLAKYPGASKGDNTQPGPVTGRIVALTENENTQVLQPLTTEFPNLKDAFLPYLLDTTANKDSAWLLIVGIAFLAAIAIWSLVNLIRHSGDPSRQPITSEISNIDDWKQIPAETENLIEKS